MNGAIWFFDTQNIGLDTKITILCAVVHKFGPKRIFVKWQKT